MYNNKSILFFLICITAQFFVASDNQSWRLIFFREYIARCKKETPISYEAFASILRTSFEVALPLAPKTGDEAKIVV